MWNTKHCLWFFMSHTLHPFFPNVEHQTLLWFFMSHLLHPFFSKVEHQTLLSNVVPKCSRKRSELLLCGLPYFKSLFTWSSVSLHHCNILSGATLHLEKDNKKRKKTTSTSNQGQGRNWIQRMGMIVKSYGDDFTIIPILWTHFLPCPSLLTHSKMFQKVKHSYPVH